MSAIGRIALADPDTVDAISDAMDPRFRELPQLLRHTALRFPEAVALRRKHCHVVEGSLEVVEYLAETSTGPRFRPILQICAWVAVRDRLRQGLIEHLERYVAPDRNALVFTDDLGGPVLRSWFEREQWWPALRRVGLGDVSWGLDTLATARLWEWQMETQRQRAELASGGHGEGAASGWRRP